MKKNTLFKGAALLIICNLIGKVIGAVYRIPLAHILGGEGMGQYQLVFPLYCLILTISTSGIPIAISKLVAEYNTQHRYNDTKKLLGVSVLVLSVISIIGTAVVIFGAKFISGIQGNPQTYICYYGIAPAVVFVGVLSALRGYFQGNLIMFPTAVSNLIEQTLKVVFGLVLARKFLSLGTEYAVFGALLGISTSEAIAFLFLIVTYFFYSKKRAKEISSSSMPFKYLSRQLFNLAVPITLGGLISPITSIVDSLIVVNLLHFVGFSSSASTTMLGLQSGIVEPLVNLPVIIAVSLSTVLLPSISSLKAENNDEKISQMIEKAFQITLSVAIVCSICYVIFDHQILSFLFGLSLRPDELFLCQKLLMLASINIIFLSLVQVSAGMLQGLGETKYPVKTLLIGCLIKVGLNLTLLAIPAVNIAGAVISGGVCYFIVFLLNYKKLKTLANFSIKYSYFYISIQACFVCFFAYFTNTLCQMLFSDLIAFFVAGALAIIVFSVTYYSFFMKRVDSGFVNKESN